MIWQRGRGVYWRRQIESEADAKFIRVAERAGIMNDGIAFLIWLCAIGVIVWFAWLGDSKLRYHMQYKGEVEVIMADKPHDCEFLTAPLGRKNCSYEQEVSTVRFSKDTNTGAPIVSDDRGKTWDWNPGGPTNGTRVYVYWVKTAD